MHGQTRRQVRGQDGDKRRDETRGTLECQTFCTARGAGAGHGGRGRGLWGRTAELVELDSRRWVKGDQDSQPAARGRCLSRDGRTGKFFTLPVTSSSLFLTSPCPTSTRPTKPSGAQPPTLLRRTPPTAPPRSSISPSASSSRHRSTTSRRPLKVEVARRSSSIGLRRRLIRGQRTLAAGQPEDMTSHGSSM